MSNSYIGYFKRRNPIKYITGILRPYKPTQVEKTKPIDEPQAKIKEEPKEEELAEEPNDDVQVLWTNGKTQGHDGHGSAVGLDHDLRDKIRRIPFSKSDRVYIDRVPPKRMYPWQNFTLETVPSRTKFQRVKSVDSLAEELIGTRRSIEKKSDSFEVVKQKVVKIDRSAMVTAYPRLGERTVEQTRINLSTDSCCLKRRSEACRVRSGYSHRKSLRCSSKVKYTPAELSNFWCTNKKEGLS